MTTQTMIQKAGWIATLCGITGVFAGALSPVLLAQTKSKDGTVYTTEPMLREILADVIFWVSFDESAEPVMGAAYPPSSTVKTVMGKYADAPGLVGKAFFNKGDCACYYPAEGNLDFSKPGALSFWISPSNWSWARDHAAEADVQLPGINFFTTTSKPDGQLGINRVGFAKKGGVATQSDHFFAYIFDFPETRKSIVPFFDLVDKWENGQWHFIVLNWTGSVFELAIDGMVRSTDIGRALRAEEVRHFFIGTSYPTDSTLIDEFMIYRHPLEEKEIMGIYKTLLP